MNKRVITLLLCIFTGFFSSTLVYAQGKSTVMPDGYFYIKSVQAGDQNLGYWDQPGVPVKFEQGANLNLYAKDNNIDQQFRFIKAGNGMYYIESKNGGIVDVEGGKIDNGTNVHIWSGHGGSNQLFSFKHMGDGRWKIYTISGRVISTPQNFNNGSNVQIWEDHEGLWTEWYLEDAKTGKNYIPGAVNKSDKKK